MRAWSWDDRNDLNHLERDLTAYAREIAEIGYTDPQEAIAKMHGAVALLSEHMGRVLRREREDEEPGEPSAIPVVETAGCRL